MEIAQNVDPWTKEMGTRSVSLPEFAGERNSENWTDNEFDGERKKNKERKWNKKGANL